MGNEGRVLKKLDRLRIDIGEAEVIGVNVKQAWLLYEEAANLLNEGKERDALTKVEKACADLERKERLFKSSKSGFIVGCVLILVIIGLCILFNFVNIEGLRDQKVLTVPLFTIAWGLIGCVTYITYTTYVKIRDKVFDWYDLNPFLFRFVLAVFFTAFTYVVAINGLITLPGTVGKEVIASIEAKDLSPEPDEEASGTSRNDSVKEKGSTSSRNSLFNIKKNVGGLIIEVGGSAPAYAITSKTGIVATNGRSGPDGYTPRRETDEPRLSMKMLEDIKDTVGVSEEPKKPDEIAEEIRIIDEGLTDIGVETEGVKYEISEIIAEPGEEGVEGGSKEEEIWKKIEVLEEMSVEAGRTEALIVAKEAELGVALEREKQPPVWESWIFILVAFISGFSVEFGAGLIERVRELFLSTAGRKPDQ